MSAWVICDTCRAEGTSPPTLAWLGRHRHGTNAVAYWPHWNTHWNTTP